jgi:hypothetical protein
MGLLLIIYKKKALALPYFILNKDLLKKNVRSYDLNY